MGACPPLPAAPRRRRDLTPAVSGGSSARARGARPLPAARAGHFHRAAAASGRRSGSCGPSPGVSAVRRAPERPLFRAVRCRGSFSGEDADLQALQRSALLAHRSHRRDAHRVPVDRGGLSARTVESGAGVPVRRAVRGSPSLRARAARRRRRRRGLTYRPPGRDCHSRVAPARLSSSEVPSRHGPGRRPPAGQIATLLNRSESGPPTRERRGRCRKLLRSCSHSIREQFRICRLPSTEQDPALRRRRRTPERADVFVDSHGSPRHSARFR